MVGVGNDLESCCVMERMAEHLIQTICGIGFPPTYGEKQTVLMFLQRLMIMIAMKLMCTAFHNYVL